MAGEGGGISLNTGGGGGALPLCPTCMASKEHLGGHCVIHKAGLDGHPWAEPLRLLSSYVSMLLLASASEFLS